MARSPSRSSDGGDSTKNLRVEPRLLKAIEEKNHEDAIAIIEQAKAKAQPHDHLLRIALVRAVERANVPMTEYLLRNGAKPDGAPGGRISPLFKANDVGIVQLLLKFGGNVDAQDKQGRTALMTAAWKNHFHIMMVLLTSGADVNKKDSRARNILHNLAADSHCNYGRDVIAELLRRDIAIDGPEGQDESNRTPLHWAASTGKKEFCEMLLQRQRAPRANINAVEVRQKTALHLAVTHDRDDIVDMLVQYGANVMAKSDGSWTPLHNACEHGNLKVVHRLLAAGADINAKLLTGMTPLHIAAQNGHLQVVNFLLQKQPETKVTARDKFGMTPFLCAAQSKTPARKDILNRLAPSNQVNALSEDALGAANGFHATVVDFGNFHNNNKVSKKTIFELLYGRDTINDRKPAFDSQMTPRAPRIQDDSELSDTGEARAPQIVVNNGLGVSVDTVAGAVETAPLAPRPKTPLRTGTVSTDQTDWTAGSSGTATGKEVKGKTKEKTKKQSKWGGSKHASKKASGTDTPTRHPDHHPRRPTMSSSLSNSGILRSPGSPGRKDPTTVAKGNIFAFMPYLHFETDSNRRHQQAAIARAEIIKDRNKHESRILKPVVQKASTYDEMLLRAHLTSSQVSLHIRRTLDQFFYHNIDTRSRDCDQVVYRYQCKSGHGEDVDPKIFMVDQLWLWTLGKDLVVTAFPQRWQQPRNDPLNVLDGIIEDINSKTREPVKNVYDLAMIIVSRCSGVFDRHRVGDEDYQFLDMFEASIGDATEQETILFKEFNVASAQASAWLQHHRRPNRFSRHLEAEERQREQNRKHATHHTNAHALLDPPIQEEEFDYTDESSHTHAPLFVDKLLDIGAETDLLAEIKDIRDELNMIAKVLEDQRNVLPDLEGSIKDIYHESNKSQQELKRRFRDMLKNIDTHIRDLERMDIQAERIYKSITDLLDLKQKHANAFEARFARDQAAGTARQSQTIMVFTIVTIIFLPLSFIAALLTVPIDSLPRPPGADQPSIPLSFVCKYVFGIGFAISIPFIAIALSYDALGDFFREVRRRFRDRKTDPNLGRDSDHRPIVGDDKMEIEYAVDMRALEQALSAGRSTLRPDGRRSTESYLTRRGYVVGGGGGGGVTLSPVASQSTARTGIKEIVRVAHGTGNGNGKDMSTLNTRLSTEMHHPSAERTSNTGFRMRSSGDVERGA
ncbi:hypothetical protein ACEQ8H_000335 [Pleosporales sp. CAS-2024a]